MKIKFYFLLIVFLGLFVKVVGQCFDSTLDNCPPMIAPPNLPCFGPQLPMLRNNLGPDINRVGNQFNYTDSEGNPVVQNESRGLARKFIARIPVLNRNGTPAIPETNVSLFNSLTQLPGTMQWRHVDATGNVIIFAQRQYARNDSPNRNPMWRYFCKYYYYNLSDAARQETNRNQDKLTLNCWIPDNSSESEFNRQNTSANINRVTNANWVSGADQPGQAIPYLICGGGIANCPTIINGIGVNTGVFPRFLNGLTNGSFCMQNNTLNPITLDVWAVNLTTGNLIRPISVANLVAPGASITIPFGLNPNEGFGIEQSGTGNFLTQVQIAMFNIINPVTGNRSPDNICRYGIERPMLNIDFFPGDRFGDKRDLNLNLR